MLRYLLTFSMILIPSWAQAEQKPSILGFWVTQDKEAIVEFYRCEKSFCGRFVWMKDEKTTTPSLDEKNPDKEKQNRPLCGMTFIKNLKQKNNGFYESGTLYSPRHGSNFSLQITHIDKNSLDLHGYMFFPALGDSETWSRTDSPNRCQTTPRPEPK